MNIGYIYVFNNKKPFLTTKDILLSLNINDPLCENITLYNKKFSAISLSLTKLKLYPKHFYFQT